MSPMRDDELTELRTRAQNWLGSPPTPRAQQINEDLLAQGVLDLLDELARERDLSRTLLTLLTAHVLENS